MDSAQGKAWFDDLMARVEAHVSRDFLRKPLETFQGVIDANWPKIWAAVPTQATEAAIVGAVFTEVRVLVAGEPYLLPLVGFIQRYTNSYLHLPAAE